MHEHEVRAEHRRLLVGLLGEAAAADPFREAEVVADQGARSRLPADATGIHHHDVEPFGGAVDRSRQARRPSADDQQVERLVLHPLRCAGSHRDLGVRGVAERRSVGQHHQREADARPRLLEELSPFLGIRQGERVRDGAALAAPPSGRMRGPTTPHRRCAPSRKPGAAHAPTRAGSWRPPRGRSRRAAGPARGRSSRSARVPSRRG